MGSHVPPPSPEVLLGSALAVHAAGCKRQLGGGRRALIKQEA